MEKFIFCTVLGAYFSDLNPNPKFSKFQISDP